MWDKKMITMKEAGNYKVVVGEALNQQLMLVRASLC
jgi:hypothetical protein